MITHCYGCKKELDLSFDCEGCDIYCDECDIPPDPCETCGDANCPGDCCHCEHCNARNI